MSEETCKVTEYRNAIVKFNNGYGALLCNKCSKILKRGFGHPDVEHYCPDNPACKPDDKPETATQKFSWNVDWSKFTP